MNTRPFRRITALAAVLSGLMAFAAPAPASDGDPAVEQRREHERTLEEVTRDLDERRAAEAALAEEIDGLRDDRAALGEALIATAASIQESEAAIGVAEGRLDALVEREQAVRESLAERSGLLTELIAALQRMGRRPPPAVLVTPEDALRTVRSAILLGAVLPGLRVETEALASDLGELVGLRSEIDTQRSRLVLRADRLEAEQRRVQALVEARRAALEDSESELDAVRARAAELAGQAASLQDLIAALDEEIAIVEPAATPDAGAVPRDSLGAFRDTSRLEPAIAFETAKGLLPMPVSGAVVRKFGAADDFGASARGMSIATRSAAQVIAPSDGWVVYAGPFRSYGALLILNAGDGYHVLLAGMESISVELGQFVLTGEPVGAMNSIVMASTENVTVERTQPVLYVEFRKDGQSIDPAPWWAEGRTGAGG